MLSKTLKIKEFKHTTKLPQSYPKATPKAQTVENQALERFFVVLWFATKRYLSNPPPTRLTSQSVGTIFAGKTFVFSIHLCHTTITTTKTIKPLKIKDLSFWVSLCGGFVVALWFLAHCKKSHYNKAPQRTDRPVSQLARFLQ